MVGFADTGDPGTESHRLRVAAPLLGETSLGGRWGVRKSPHNNPLAIINLRLCDCGAGLSRPAAGLACHDAEHAGIDRVPTVVEPLRAEATRILVGGLGPERPVGQPDRVDPEGAGGGQASAEVADGREAELLDRALLGLPGQVPSFQPVRRGRGGGEVVGEVPRFDVRHGFTTGWISAT